MKLLVSSLIVWGIIGISDFIIWKVIQNSKSGVDILGLNFGGVSSFYLLLGIITFSGLVGIVLVAILYTVLERY